MPDGAPLGPAGHDDLLRDREMLADQLVAAEAVLVALGRSSSTADADAVLVTVAESARRLCRCQGVTIYLLDGEKFELAATVGLSDEFWAYVKAHPLRRDRESMAGRAALDRRIEQIVDVLDDPGYGRRDMHEILGHRTVIAAPLILDEEVVGAITLFRTEVEPFDERTTAMLRGFAVQTAAAVRNMLLVRELERRQRELADKVEQLQVASEHKSAFLASMSHELRTPLNAVIGFSEVLLDRMFGELNERQAEYLEDILSSGRHLLELLSEILDLSKVEAGRMELDLSTFSVRQVIEHATALVRERAVAHGIALAVEIDPAVQLIFSDELRFKQVVLNLLSNAVKFTPDGGHVEVRASRTERRLTVTVTDDGIGVPAEDTERIFEAFHQGGRGATREEGTGLGLTLCRRIVTLMGGEMTLRSEVGTGSTFGFTIPIREDAPHEPVSGDGDDPVVVMIDDDRASLDLVSAYLDGTGVRMVRASDGTRGLTSTRRLRPAAVLLDIRLPDIDGWEVLRQLQLDPQTAPVPVIIVSIVDDRPRGIAAGAADYLLKPVGRDTLLDALRRAGVALDGSLESPVR